MHEELLEAQHPDTTSCNIERYGLWLVCALSVLAALAHVLNLIFMLRYVAPAQKA